MSVRWRTNQHDSAPNRGRLAATRPAKSAVRARCGFPVSGATRDALEQKLDAAAIDAVTLHQKTDQRIFDEFDERVLCGFGVHLRFS